MAEPKSQWIPEVEAMLRYYGFDPDEVVSFSYDEKLNHDERLFDVALRKAMRRPR